jgi:hypothetical protein
VDRVCGRRTKCLLISFFFKKAVFLCMSFWKTCTTRCWRMLRQQSIGRHDVTTLTDYGWLEGRPSIAPALHRNLPGSSPAIVRWVWKAGAGGLSPSPALRRCSASPCWVQGKRPTTDDLGLNQTHGMIPHPERQIFFTVHDPLTRAY